MSEHWRARLKRPKSDETGALTARGLAEAAMRGAPEDLEAVRAFLERPPTGRPMDALRGHLFHALCMQPEPEARDPGPWTGGMEGIEEWTGGMEDLEERAEGWCLSTDPAELESCARGCQRLAAAPGQAAARLRDLEALHFDAQTYLRLMQMLRPPTAATAGALAEVEAWIVHKGQYCQSERAQVSARECFEGSHISIVQVRRSGADEVFTALCLVASEEVNRLSEECDVALAAVAGRPELASARFRDIALLHIVTEHIRCMYKDAYYVRTHHNLNDMRPGDFLVDMDASVYFCTLQPGVLEGPYETAVEALLAWRRGHTRYALWAA